MRRLSRAGFKREFVSTAILPDWWDDACSRDSALLPEIELRVARFLEVPLAMVADPAASLQPPRYQAAHLRRVRDIDRDRIAPAIHGGIRIAAAVVRNLREPRTPVKVPPRSGFGWRQEIDRVSPGVRLDDVVRDLWGRGIPVIPAEILPSPGFQGLAAIVENRPVIVVGYRHDEPGRVAFLISHEAGHIAAGDCAPGVPVVDEDEEIATDDAMEGRADQFAIQMMVGSDAIPEIDRDQIQSFKDLAKTAVALERTSGADASALIYSWARVTGDYPTATMATKALYRASGAGSTLRNYFDEFVDVAGAPESDRELLRCVVAEQ